MRLVFSCLALLAAVSASAERMVTIGEYSDEIRGKVAAKLAEALDVGGHEARMSGVVTYANDDCFFIQKEQDGMKVISRAVAMPKVGDEIEVTGVPALDGGRVVFTARGWRRVGVGTLPETRPVAMDDLVSVAGTKRSVNWLRVAMAGRVIGKTEGGVAMSVDGVPVNVLLSQLPGELSDCDRTRPRVTVKGVVELMLDQSALVNATGKMPVAPGNGSATGKTPVVPEVIGVKVYAASSGDIVLVPDLGYYAARRNQLVMTVGSFALGGLGLGVVVFLVVICRQRRRMFRVRTLMAERKRMADDLHDTIEQHLVGVGMLLRLNRLKEAQDVLVRAKREIRDIVWGLKNDDMMRLSPTEMLRQLAHEENTKGLYRVETRFEGLPTKMDAASMRDLCLIVREAIGNAVKHGGAKHIAITTDPLDGGGWMLRISNDGTPFDPKTAPGAKDGHFGLEGMRQRARRLCATIDFAPHKGGMVATLEKRNDTRGNR